MTNNQLPVLVVCGATGQQGGSLAYAALRQSPRKFAVRAIVRDLTKESAKSLQEAGAELFHLPNGLQDTQTLQKAFEGAKGAFIYTVADPKTNQTDLGKGAVDAALEAASQSGKPAPWIVWSTGPDATAVSGGKRPVLIYDQQANVDKYIIKRDADATFLRLGMFMENLIDFHWLQWNKDEAKLTLSIPMAPVDVGLRINSTQHDVGPAVLSLFDVAVYGSEAERAKIRQAYVDVSFNWLSMQQIAEQLGKTLNVKAEVATMKAETIRKFMPEEAAENVINLLSFVGEYDSADAGTETGRAKMASHPLPSPLLLQKGVTFDSVEQFAKRVIQPWLTEQQK